MPVVAVVAFVAGAALVVFVVMSAIRTVVLPRGTPVYLSRLVFLAVRRVFDVLGHRARTYEDRDRAMALYAPMALMTLPVVWLTLVLTGYAAMQWAVGARPLRTAFTLSGSSLLTLGFAVPRTAPSVVLAFTEAAIGVGMIALMITYLPSMYGTFSRREAAVALLEVRAGSPPSAIEMIQRFHAIGWSEQLTDVWRAWEAWFVDLEETHTSFPALVFFRSPQPQHSWVTAAGAVLDAAALRASTLDLPREPEAEVCIRAGYIALRRIAAFFRIPFDPDPRPDDPISVTREEYDEIHAELAAAGLPLKPDVDQSWRDWAGWRVNYDTVLLALATLTLAPYARWSSDRSPLAAGIRRSAEIGAGD